MLQKKARVEQKLGGKQWKILLRFPPDVSEAWVGAGASPREEGRGLARHRNAQRCLSCGALCHLTFSMDPSLQPSPSCT